MDLVLLRGQMLGEVLGGLLPAGLLAQAMPTGDYVSWWKALIVLLIILPWARLLTWADKDAIYAHMPRDTVNSAMLGGFILAFALFLFVPNFWAALGVLLFIFACEAGIYLGWRSKVVGLGDLKGQFNDWMKGMGKGKEKAQVAVPGQVMITNRMGQPMPVPDAEDPMRPAYDAVQLILTDPLQKNAERVDCAPEKDIAVVKYYVDGVQYTSGSMPKHDSGLAIGYLKSAAGLDFNERRKPQTGLIKVAIDGQRKELTVQTAGSTAGEVMRLLADVKKQHTQRIDELGMQPHQLELLRNTIAEQGGVVIVSAPKDQGLTTMFYAILRAHDAFLTHIQTIERDPDQDLEGITQNKLAAGANPAEETKQTEWIISQEVDVLGLSLVEAPETARAVAKFALGENGRRVYVGLRASSTFEALSQWRKLVGDDKLAINSLRMVINGRVLRRLCAACKIAFSPDPAMLKKLNLSGEIQQLFQARTEPLRDPKGNPLRCEFCKDLRFRGRTGFFELLLVDDRVRDVVLSGGSTEQLKAAFRKQRGQYLQETALKMVESGDTSIQEVLRVLKPAGATARTG
jgi:type II secretory ATPase GspE/PulE/Tfp pilus assembly ATPase PilB-like protein